MSVKILFVDDEQRILRSLALQFRRQYEVLTESDPQRALERLRQESVQILVSDQRMPRMNGTELLSRAQQIAPQCLRILLTGYSDLDAAMEALNSGGIYRYLTKPWDPQEMSDTLRQAAELAQRSVACAPPPVAVPESGVQLNVLLLDEDSQTQDCVASFCSDAGHRLLQARSLTDAIELLDTVRVDLLVTDLRSGGQDASPLLKSLAQANPRLLSLVVTSFRDTQALLRLINEAQIYRYLPKPIRRGMLERSLKAAEEQLVAWHRQPALSVPRVAELPREDSEKARVSGLLGMLGRLRNRISA